MTAESVHICANCQTPCERFLCPRCAAICDCLTSAGLYREYLNGSIDEVRLPPNVRRLLERSPQPSPPSLQVRHFLDDQEDGDRLGVAKSERSRWS